MERYEKLMKKMMAELEEAKQDQINEIEDAEDCPELLEIEKMYLESILETIEDVKNFSEEELMRYNKKVMTLVEKKYEEKKNAPKITVRTNDSADNNATIKREIAERDYDFDAMPKIIVVSDDEVIDGNHRVVLAEMLGRLGELEVYNVGEEVEEWLDRDSDDEEFFDWAKENGTKVIIEKVTNVWGESNEN